MRLQDVHCLILGAPETEHADFMQQIDALRGLVVGDCLHKLVGGSNGWAHVLHSPSDRMQTRRSVSFTPGFTVYEVWALKMPLMN
jgi:hypothetical protein